MDEARGPGQVDRPRPGDEASELQTRFRGKRYLSRARGTLLMYYAREPFDRAGIPYPREGWTSTPSSWTSNRRLTRLVDGRQTYAYQWSGAICATPPGGGRTATWSGTASPSPAEGPGTPGR